MPYRDDQAALETRRDELRSALEDATRRAEALEGAAAEKERLARELASVDARLARSTARRLPLLERVSVASPCTQSWDAMVGDDRARFCDACAKNVFNLSAMTSAEAEALLVEHGEKLCVRLYRRKDGTVLTADCPVGVRKKRVRRVVALVAGAGAMAGGAMSLFARQGRVTMGDVAMTQDPPTMGVMVPVPPTATAEPAPAVMGSAVVEAPAAPTQTARPGMRMGGVRMKSPR
jgi:hypothetical protein